MKARKSQRKRSTIARVRVGSARTGYASWSGGIASLLDESRRQAARSVNAILTATYWEIGRRIVEFVQAGEARAEYGDEVLEHLSRDLTKRFERGFGKSVLFQMRGFYLTHADIFQTLSGKSGAAIFGFQIFQTASGKSLTNLKQQTPSAESDICGTLSRKSGNTEMLQTVSAKSSIDLTLYLEALAHAFPLSWSHYVRLLSVEKPEARKFYETESLQGGWSVRQLDRQISTLFYERTALSKNKAKMLTSGAKPRPEDAVSIEEEIKSPYVLEFLNLRDDYAAEHLTLEGENPPVGLVLCSEHDDAVAHYSMGNLRNKVLAAQYKLALPEARLLEAEIEKTRHLLESPARRMHQKSGRP